MMFLFGFVVGMPVGVLLFVCGCNFLAWMDDRRVRPHTPKPHPPPTREPTLLELLP